MKHRYVLPVLLGILLFPASSAMQKLADQHDVHNAGDAPELSVRPADLIALEHITQQLHLCQSTIEQAQCAYAANDIAIQVLEHEHFPHKNRILKKKLKGLHNARQTIQLYTDVQTQLFGNIEHLAQHGHSLYAHHFLADACAGGLFGYPLNLPKAQFHRDVVMTAAYLAHVAHETMHYTTPGTTHVIAKQQEQKTEPAPQHAAANPSPPIAQKRSIFEVAGVTQKPTRDQLIPFYHRQQEPEDFVNASKLMPSTENDVEEIFFDAREDLPTAEETELAELMRTYHYHRDFPSLPQATHSEGLTSSKQLAEVPKSELLATLEKITEGKAVIRPAGNTVQEKGVLTKQIRKALAKAAKPVLLKMAADSPVVTKSSKRKKKSAAKPVAHVSPEKLIFVMPEEETNPFIILEQAQRAQLSVEKIGLMAHAIDAGKKHPTFPVGDVAYELALMYTDEDQKHEYIRYMSIAADCGHTGALQKMVPHYLERNRDVDAIAWMEMLLTQESMLTLEARTQRAQYLFRLGNAYIHKAPTSKDKKEYTQKSREHHASAQELNEPPVLIEYVRNNFAAPEHDRTALRTTAAQLILALSETSNDTNMPDYVRQAHKLLGDYKVQTDENAAQKHYLLAGQEGLYPCGCIYENQHTYVQARECFEHALQYVQQQIKPDATFIKTLQGKIALCNGKLAQDTQTQIRYFNEGAQLGNFAAQYLEISTIFNTITEKPTHEFIERIQLLAQKRTMHKDYPWITPSDIDFLLANAYLEAGHYQRAVPLYERVIKQTCIKEPHIASSAHTNLGCAYMNIIKLHDKGELRKLKEDVLQEGASVKLKLSEKEVDTMRNQCIAHTIQGLRIAQEHADEPNNIKYLLSSLIRLDADALSNAHGPLTWHTLIRSHMTQTEFDAYFKHLINFLVTPFRNKPLTEIAKISCVLDISKTLEALGYLKSNTQNNARSAIVELTQLLRDCESATPKLQDPQREQFVKNSLEKAKAAKQAGNIAQARELLIAAHLQTKYVDEVNEVVYELACLYIMDGGPDAQRNYDNALRLFHMIEGDSTYTAKILQKKLIIFKFTGQETKTTL